MTTTTTTPAKGFGAAPSFKTAPPMPPNTKPAGAPVPPVGGAPVPPVGVPITPAAVATPPAAVATPPVPPMGSIPEQDNKELNDAVASSGKKEKKEKKTRVRSEIEIEPEHIKYVLQNIKDMSYTDMAGNLGITRNQINRILQTLKGGINQKGEPFGLRGDALVKASETGEQAYALKENGRPNFNEPISARAQQVEALINDQLSRPAESRPGGGAGRKGSGKVKDALNMELEELLNSLG